MKIEVEKHIWKIICLALVVVTLGLLFRNWTLKQRIVALEGDKEEYATKESKAYIVERISKQMEEIAYQQKEISDQQREEAVHQMGIAEKMRVRAEEGENLAKKEQHKAQQYALHLEDARNVAEGERARAVKQQRLAEAARNQADTLSRISLARSLASSSLIQYQSGNHEVSGLLAYGAWRLMKNYKGNVYHPIIYDALSKNSESSLSKKIHKGGVSRIVRSKLDDKRYVSVSKYGEICSWYRDRNNLNQKLLFSDATYSFRDVFIDGKGTIYALDFEGRLLILRDKEENRIVLLPEARGWQRICPLSPNLFMLVASNHLYFFDSSKQQIVNKCATSESISSVGNQNGNWLIFGKNKGCWRVDEKGTLGTCEIKVGEAITAYAWSEENHQAAVGTMSGNIYLLDETGKILENLVGHRSRVTQLAFAGNNLFSSSYDCTVNIWNLDSPKIEALSLMQVSAWIYCFQLSTDNSIWIGDESGMVHRILISPDDMAKLVKRNLKRDFTDEEWTYYFGKDLQRVRLNTLDE